jgi:hypothetical protein
MTLTEFEHGYWYALELKEFAKNIGIPFANKLRKDEIETSIKYFLKTGQIKSPTKRGLSISGPKDIELGLSLDLPVVVYTNDKETKAFLDREAQKIAPGLKEEIRRALSAQPLAGKATRQGHPNYIWRHGPTIRSA